MGSGASALLEVSKQLDMTHDERQRYRTYYVDLEKLGKNPKQIVNVLEDKLIEERKQLKIIKETKDTKAVEENENDSPDGIAKLSPRKRHNVTKLPIPKVTTTYARRPSQEKVIISKPPSSTVNRNGSNASPNVKPTASNEIKDDGLVKSGSVLSVVPTISNPTPRSGRDIDTNVNRSSSNNTSNGVTARLDSNENNPNQLECTLCKAVFPTNGQYNRHVKFSQMHARLLKEMLFAQEQSDRANKVAMWVHDLIDKLQEKSLEERLAGKSRACCRWLRACHKIILQNRIAHTKDMLCRFYAVDVGKTPYQEGNVIYHDNKFFWRTQDTIELHFYLHDIPELLIPSGQQTGRSGGVGGGYPLGAYQPPKLSPTTDDVVIRQFSNATATGSVAVSAMDSPTERSSTCNNSFNLSTCNSVSYSINPVRVLEICGFNQVSKRELERLHFDYNALLSHLQVEIRRAQIGTSNARRHSFGDCSINVHKVNKDAVIKFLLPKLELQPIPGRAACQRIVFSGLNCNDVSQQQQQVSSPRAILDGTSKQTNNNINNNNITNIIGGSNSNTKNSNNKDASILVTTGIDNGNSNSNSSNIEAMTGGLVVSEDALHAQGFRPVDIYRKPQQTVSKPVAAQALADLAHHTQELTSLMSKAAHYAGLSMSETASHAVVSVEHMLTHQKHLTTVDAKPSANRESNGDNNAEMPAKKFLLLSPQKKQRRKSIH